MQLPYYLSFKLLFIFVLYRFDTGLIKNSKTHLFFLDDGFLSGGPSPTQYAHP